MKKIKNTEGITLIALVVTVVVLLILASISVHSLKGDNGVIKQAKKAKYETEFAKENEVIELAKVEVSKKDQELTKDTLQKALDQIEGTGKTIVMEIGDSNELEITFTETNYKHNVETSIYIVSEEQQSYWTYKDNDDGTVTLLKYNPPHSKLSELKTLVVPNKLNGKTVKCIGSGVTEYNDGIWGQNISTSGYYHSEPVDSQNTIEKLVIQKNIKEIANGAFVNGLKIKEIELNRGITRIGNNAFGGCKNLEKINIPSGVEEIGGWAFGWCESLKEINIPKSVANMGYGLFFSHWDNYKVTINLEAKSIPTTWNEYWNYCWSPTINYGVQM